MMEFGQKFMVLYTNGNVREVYIQIPIANLR